MPTYDYKCTACDDVFEISRSMGQTGDVSCPVCDAPAKRVFSPVGVAFKGSGFHNTDYKPRPKDDGACPAKSAGSCPSAST